MFGYQYKKDAMKWREHKKKQDDDELSKTAKMMCKVHLKGGDVLDCELVSSARKVTYKEEIDIFGFTYRDVTDVFRCTTLINDKFDFLCYDANTRGLHIDGSFYPSCQIQRIERGEIEVTTNEK